LDTSLHNEKGTKLPEKTDELFCGPSMVFTVYNPRAHIRRMDELRNTVVKKGATLGANCTIICGHSIGRYAFVGAGAVVTRDVPDHAPPWWWAIRPDRLAGCANAERNWMTPSNAPNVATPLTSWRRSGRLRELDISRPIFHILWEGSSFDCF